MNVSKLNCLLGAVFALSTLTTVNTGCAKEYSYEGMDTTAVIIPITPVHDSISTITDTTNEFPVCTFCAPVPELPLGTWSFKKGRSYLCGGITNSGFFSGYTKKDITFFGPSACSGDTGIVVSVFLPVPLDQDRYNLTATASAFYYYDNTAPKDIFISEPEKPFSVTVKSFKLSTGIATGTFSGTVFRANGDTAFVAEGRYKVYIK